jgi:hypothetical protein
VLEKVIDRRLGHESVDPPAGWSWDYRYLVEDRITETLPFPGLKKNHLSGIPRSYWQNGPIAGKTGKSLKIEEIREVFAKGRRRWVPFVYSGNINIWRESSYLFSDDSVVEVLDATSIDSGGRSLHILQRELRPGSPILATIFRRDRDNEYLPWRIYSHRINFTSILDSDGNEQTTRDGDTIYWSVVDTDKREFISYERNGSIYCLFNSLVPESITSGEEPSVIADFNDLEYLGDSDGSDDQSFETSKFPISGNSLLKVYAVDVTGSSYEEYTVVSTFTGSEQVKVDEDLGILTFGSSTGPASPPAAGLGIYINYSVTPRIEYEEEGYSEVTAVIDADVNPLSQSLNKGFVTLARTELDIASIELTTTEARYPGIANTFGPIYAGADYAPLTATVYSSSGEIIPNVEVTFFFEVTPSIGGIGGSSTSTQRRTGINGTAHTYYVPPNSVSSMGFSVQNSGNVLQLPADANFSNVQDVYTYYILKDDPFIGVPAADTSIGEVEWSSSELNGRKVVLYKWNASAINPISGHFGAYAPIRPASISSGYILTYTDTLADSDTSGYGSTVRLGTATSYGLNWFKDTTKSWTVNEWHGYVIESTSNSSLRRRIASNTSNTLYFTSPFSELPTTGGYRIYDKADNLGGYWVVSDRFVTIRASAYSPRLRKTIYSNILSLRVEIPDYMKGSYINSSLQEIPFGWRLVDDTYEQASAIDGATYISINPIAGPYPIIDVIGGETWDPYSGDLGEEPYPWWPYGDYPGSGVGSPFAYWSIKWEVV